MAFTRSLFNAGFPHQDCDRPSPGHGGIATPGAYPRDSSIGPAIVVPGEM